MADRNLGRRLSALIDTAHPLVKAYVFALEVMLAWTRGEITRHEASLAIGMPPDAVEAHRDRVCEAVRTAFEKFGEKEAK